MLWLCLTSPDGAGSPVALPASGVLSLFWGVPLVHSSREGGVEVSTMSGLSLAPTRGVTFQIFLSLEDRENGSRDLCGLFHGDESRLIVLETGSSTTLWTWPQNDPTIPGLALGSIVAFEHPSCVHQMIVLDQTIKVFSPGLQSRSSSLRCLLFVTTKFKNM